MAKNSLPLPIYDTSNDGEDHLPQFKCNVTEMVQNIIHLLDLITRRKQRTLQLRWRLKTCLSRVWISSLKRQESVLNNLALKKKIPLPTYQFTKEGDAHCPTFIATVEFNVACYTGAPGNNKEAASKAAYEAIQSINAQNCNLFSQFELQDENTKTMILSNLVKNARFPRKVSYSAENSTEKLNVEKAPVLEKVPEKLNVRDPCLVGQGLQKSMGKDSGEVENGKPSINDAISGSAPLEQPQQDPILVEQHRVKEEGRDLCQDMECGFKELEGKQQGSQEVVLTESVGKRSRSDYENVEQISERKKKHRRKNKVKRKKNDGTA